jgi:heptosyltransferase-2
LSRRKSKTVELPDGPKLLVMETGLIGELLVITPALRALRKHRPDAHITVIVRPGSAPVLIGNPNVDRLLPLSGRQRKGVWGLMSQASWVRSKDFDAALVLHTSFRSALIASMAAVPVRAGLSCEGRGFLLTHKKPRDRAAYEVDEHLAIVGLLGVPPDGRDMDLFLTDDERAGAREMLGDALDRRPLVGLHPGASREIRRWPVGRFVALADMLRRELGVTPVFFFGPGEEGLARAVSQFAEAPLAEGSGSRAEVPGSPAPVLCHPGNVRLLAAAFELMDAVVTNNTGPMHIAAAVGVPGVFIHGPTPVPRWQPPGERYTALYAADLACRPCDTSTCAQERLLCMEGVTVDRVFEAVAAALSATPSEPRSMSPSTSLSASAGGSAA